MGNPPVHALWKFVYKVAEFSTLAVFNIANISVWDMLHCMKLIKPFEIKFYPFEMKDPLISV